MRSSVVALVLLLFASACGDGPIGSFELDLYVTPPERLAEARGLWLTTVEDDDAAATQALCGPAEWTYAGTIMTPTDDEPVLVKAVLYPRTSVVRVVAALTSSFEGAPTARANDPVSVSEALEWRICDELGTSDCTNAWIAGTTFEPFVGCPIRVAM